MIATRALRNTTAAMAIALAAVLALAAPAAQAAAPAFSITSISTPSHFPASDSSGLSSYLIVARNVGGAPTDGTPITISDVLPAGVTVSAVTPVSEPFMIGDNSLRVPCDPTPPVSCTTPTGPGIGTSGIVYPGGTLEMFIPVDIAPGAGPLAINNVTISGGGAPTVSDSEQTPVGGPQATFGFQDSSSSFTDADGEPATQAGSHPHQASTYFLLNSVFSSSQPYNPPAAKLKDVRVKLPTGMVVNPSATPRCTASELENNANSTTTACPEASAVGLVHPAVGILHYPELNLAAALYNMVPPPGVPAEFAFQVAPFGNEAVVHIQGGVDSAGNYQLTAKSSDLVQYVGPTGVAVELWGNPADPSHDHRRGHCSEQFPAATQGLTCPVPASDTPFLTMPTACSGPLESSYSAASAEDPGNFLTAISQAQDIFGDPFALTGCAALDFAPTLKARPTTNAADAPSGLSVDLHVPQTDSLGALATAHLKKTVVTLPEGLVVNPSGANGLGACSAAQIGLTTAIGSTPIHFSADRPNCPDASRIGTVEVDTPLLENPLAGSVYIAKPHDNPFDSLLALYVVVDDPRTGVVAKLAGRIEPDPQTGRLTTTFDENPQLPFEDFRLEFFGGAYGPLRTPVTCGTYSTTSSLSPWSGNPPATPSDSYAISQGPGGGACIDSPAAAPNSPSFDAGTTSAIAGTYAPFVVHLRREDGSQNFSALNVSPPPGLIAKLAGTTTCSDAALASAAARSGSEEKASPSCPASSDVGSAAAGAGAGPAPYYAPGRVYVAGPYKGAPISLAIVTPAVAGPFDLGTVVVRTPVYIDSRTARISAVSDPIPSILQGIPLDVRTVDVSLDRPQFTFNPTSCDPMAVSGLLTSTLGQAVPLSSRFQVAECARLGFKPKLSLRLKGGTRRGQNPALTAVLQPRPGDANLASVSVALPRSEFLDQAHIGTVCTRVQFAADACPAASVYGTATVTTPVLDYPLTAKVYLRSSDNLLPDLVPDFRGPAFQPIRLEAAGRTDSVKGGIRNTFDFVPDAPFTKLVLSLPGGSKSLLENSTDICRKKFRATVKYGAHNGKTYEAQPLLKTKCGGKKRGKKKTPGRAHRVAR